MGDYAPPTTRGQTLLALAHALGGGQKASGSTILGDAIRNALAAHPPAAPPPLTLAALLARSRAATPPVSTILTAPAANPLALQSPPGSLASLFAEPDNTPAALSASANQSLLGGAGYAAPVMLWMYVRGRFGRFLSNLEITDNQRENAETARGGVIASLNRWYFAYPPGTTDSLLETANSVLIGSWGKGTQVRPPRDVDLIFILPSSVYWRYQNRVGNRQSDLLQEVKEVLEVTYPQTTMRGDGQVVVVGFNTTAVEVAPGFRCADGSIIICNTKDGGRYITSTAEPEFADLAASDEAWNGNTRALVRMMKRWQEEKNVPIKSFVLERLAIEFLRQWPYSHYDVFYYDWMIRDFLAYLIGRVGGSVIMPLTGEVVQLGREWLSRAATAHGHAVNACYYERDNYEIHAGEAWQSIFGSMVPVQVS